MDDILFVEDYISLEDIDDFRYLADLFAYTSGVGRFNKALSTLKPGVYRLGEDLSFLRFIGLSVVYSLKIQSAATYDVATLYYYVDYGIGLDVKAAQCKHHRDQKLYSMFPRPIDEVIKHTRKKQSGRISVQVNFQKGEGISTLRAAKISTGPDSYVVEDLKSNLSFPCRFGTELKCSFKLNDISKLQVGFVPVADYKNKVVKLVPAIAFSLRETYKTYVAIPPLNYGKEMVRTFSVLPNALVGLIVLHNVFARGAGESNRIPLVQSIVIRGDKNITSMSLNVGVIDDSDVLSQISGGLSMVSLRSYITGNICKITKYRKVVILPKTWFDKNKVKDDKLVPIAFGDVGSLVIFPYKHTYKTPLKPVLVDCNACKERTSYVFYDTWYAVLDGLLVIFRKTWHLFGKLANVGYLDLRSFLSAVDGWWAEDTMRLTFYSGALYILPGVYVPLDDEYYLYSGITCACDQVTLGPGCKLCKKENSFDNILTDLSDGISVVTWAKLNNRNYIVLNPSCKGIDCSFGDWLIEASACKGEVGDIIQYCPNMKYMSPIFASGDCGLYGTVFLDKKKAKEIKRVEEAVASYLSLMNVLGNKKPKGPLLYQFRRLPIGAVQSTW